MRYLEDELRRSACSYLEGLRIYELNIVWNVSFVNEFAPKPFVKDVFNRLKVFSKLHTQSDRVSRFEKPYECLAVGHSLPCRVSFACRGRYRYKCHEKRALQMPFRP